MHRKSLLELQRLVQASLHSGQPRPEVLDLIVEKPAASIEERVQIYQNAYLIRLTESIREDFAEVELHLGTERFSALVEEYVMSTPSRSRNLAEYSAAFPEFVAGKDSELVEIATIAWMKILADQPERETKKLSLERILAGDSFVVRTASTTVRRTFRSKNVLVFAGDDEVVAIEVTTTRSKLLSFLEHERSLNEIEGYASLENLVFGEVERSLLEWVRDGVVVCLPSVSTETNGENHEN